MKAQQVPSSSSSAQPCRAGYGAVRDESPVPRAIAHAPAHSNAASQITPSHTTTLAGENEHNYVKKFLIICNLPVDRILPQVLQLGIHDSKTLAIVAGLKWRDMWLDGVLQLTPIQFKLLKDGLNMLATRGREKQVLRQAD